ncbi:DUF618-domain-containing protein [Gonapodya prolifera JEL478]|uniref:DUF618-domain-containing protein n=1 Tax=Gonapodya prolifera (strain JEL478) TaxID=1344416 RepID=A0A139AUV1_GONPJ|nr:DUF618-domain-containing protein [Gonapodya prolifera JEL478]|eukprot:KXS20498.1 DUF618-domain-containing protein [Gonapodya prolifera JEL478]
MTSFSEATLLDKLSKLSDSQDSIGHLSQYIQYHRKNAKMIVATWFKELRRAAPSKKLLFMYLCNDVVQNSRKKHEDFVKYFSEVLPDGVEHIAKHTPPDVQAKVLRVVNILEERGVYKPPYVQGLRDRIARIKATTPSASASSSRSSSSSSSSVLGKRDRAGNSLARVAAVAEGNVAEEAKPLVHLLQELHKNDLEIEHIAERCDKVPTKFFNEDTMRGFVGTPDATVAAGEVGSAINQLDQLRDRIRAQRKERLQCVEELRKLADMWEHDGKWQERIESVADKVEQLKKVHGHLTGATPASIPSPVTSNPTTPVTNGETPMLFEPRTPDYDPDPDPSHPSSRSYIPSFPPSTMVPSTLLQNVVVPPGLSGLDGLGDADLDMGAFLDFGAVSGDLGMGMGMEMGIGDFGLHTGDRETTDMRPPSPEPLTPPGE